MKPETALALVLRYSELTKGIKAAKARIGDHMEACKGRSGKRNQIDPVTYDIQLREEDEKGRDKDLHLWYWYQPEYGGNEEPEVFYEEILAKKHGIECPHCYAAHLVIQDRKTMRKQLAHVKGAMTRSTT